MNEYKMLLRVYTKLDAKKNTRHFIPKLISKTQSEIT